VALCVLDKGKLSVEYYNDNTHLTDSLSTFANQAWWKKHSDVDYSNLRIEPMDLDADAELYSSCYADAWKAAHGSLIGFAEAPYLQNAKRIAQRNPEYVVKSYYGSDFAGIAELDPEMMSFVGAGWISFCYLSPEYRGHGFGPQLVGHAVSVFRKLNRTSLRLHVAQTNIHAIEFYEKLGFKHISTDKGVICPLLLMELPL
ncbi:MAG: GNAT family N-acetyltransferase, partial [Clostridia bacterium]|nr:GNAT family N-acetyltransferase [Clostridia bacterium]